MRAMRARRRPLFALVTLIGLAAIATPQTPRAAPTDAAPSRFTPTLANNPQVQVALQWIEAHRAEHMREWIRITEIPAPSHLEQDRAHYITDQLHAIGLDSVRTDSIGNVIA